MTLKEAREAAINRLPILCDGCRYERIGLVGMKYSERNDEETPSILLIDKFGREVWALPGRCEVANDET